jgi:hypothetical protein
MKKIVEYDESEHRQPNDDDTAKVSAPIDTCLFEFYDALTGMQIECAQLSTSIRRGDSEGARICAEDAVSLYFAAKDALRCLEPGRMQAAKDVRIATLALSHARAVLQNVFDRAAQQIATPLMHRLLRRLRRDLALANGEPPPMDIGAASTQQHVA